jgi:hypothetical protein
MSENRVAIRPEVKEILERVKAKTVSRARLIFALDATASREPTWDMACGLQSQMFSEVASIGGLSIQLVFYRGIECRTSNWVDDPNQLAAMMRKIKCEGGYTQIGKILSHVQREHKKEPVAALVFVGDAFEESRDRDEIVGTARTLGIPAFMFQEGHNPKAEQVFHEIARLTGGAYCRFDRAAAKQLSELLKAVARFAVGGLAALEGRNDAGSVRLIAQLK